MTKKEYCLSHDNIAYYSGVGGVEIHGIEGDYIYCTSSAWYPPKKYHKVKIHYDHKRCHKIRFSCACAN